VASMPTSATDGSRPATNPRERSSVLLFTGARCVATAEPSRTGLRPTDDVTAQPRSR
jgi:hypothetical protein